MRVLLVCLLAAISYAQTVAELEDHDSKAVAPVKFKEFTNPQNIAGARMKKWRPQDLDMEIPLSMSFGSETPVGGIYETFNKFKDSCTSAAIKKVRKNIETKAENIKNWVKGITDKSDLVHPLLQAGADVYSMIKDLIKLVKNWKGTLEKFKKAATTVEKQSAADEFFPNYVNQAADKVNRLRNFLGFVGSEGVLTAIGFNWGYHVTGILGAGDSITAFVGLEAPANLEKTGEKLAMSVCVTAAFEVGPKLDISTDFGIVISHNTAPGGEAGFGLSVDLKAIAAGGLKWTFNWAFRNKKMEFVGITIGGGAGSGAGIGLLGGYTGTIFKYATPRKGALKNVFKDAKNAAKKAGSGIKNAFKEHMKERYDIDIGYTARAEAAVNEPQTPVETVKSTETKVQNSLSATDNIKRVFGTLNPTIVECFAGLFLLVALIFFSSRNAEKKDDYLLIADDCDEL